MKIIIPIMLAALIAHRGYGQEYKIRGELKKFHKITITFDGPETSEFAEKNPFLDYRLTVTFSNGAATYVVPGYYAADGTAGQTSANSGDKWQVRFSPDQAGEWTFVASFREGKAVAVNDSVSAGQAAAFDGVSGSFQVDETDKTGSDFRGKGRLLYVGERYLQFAQTGEYYLKAGADSPENFLAYYEFDQTTPTHKYKPHSSDWKEADLTWKDGKGKNIIGAVNYLASKGMNCVYMLTMNVMGDGNDVWPWTSINERYRFDVSKLDQWEALFTHMDQLGLMLHFVTQETENELLLDIGFTQNQRQLYYRELIARFAHHPALTWNLGEENGTAHWTPMGQNDEQRKAMADYIKQVDPYDNFVVIHTHSGTPGRDRIITPLVGHPTLDGLSLQVDNPSDVHQATKDWIERSDASARKWVINIDEIGHHSKGVMPDESDPDHDTVRWEALWGNLMAGGGGAEWYFGYEFPHMDLNCEDWRSRDKMWDQTRIAVEFFQNHLPFVQMTSRDQLTSTEAYCFAQPGVIYAVYLKPGAVAELDLSGVSGRFKVFWFNPKLGGQLQEESKKQIKAGGRISLGKPPGSTDQDWLALIHR